VYVLSRIELEKERESGQKGQFTSRNKSLLKPNRGSGAKSESIATREWGGSLNTEIYAKNKIVWGEPGIRIGQNCYGSVVNRSKKLKTRGACQGVPGNLTTFANS